MRRIVCLGDSLTSGHGIGTAAAYPALLHQRVRRAGFPYEVVNAGVSRDTSAHARARLETSVRKDMAEGSATQQELDCAKPLHHVLKYIVHFTFSSEVAHAAGRVLAIVAQPTQIGPSLREPSNASARGARTRGSRTHGSHTHGSRTHGSRTGGSRTSTRGCRRKPRRSSNDMRQGSSVRHSNA